MRNYRCNGCGHVIETLPENYVAPTLLQRERTPVCCGRDMKEFVD